MSKREIRYLVILAVIGFLIAGGALFVTEMQRSSQRAVQDQQAIIRQTEQSLDATARAKQP